MKAKKAATPVGKFWWRLGMAGTMSLLVGSAPAFEIATVLVGNAGNQNDNTGFGAVGYAFHIGTYEVTNAEYLQFLNSADPAGLNPSGIYNPSMSTDPVGGIAFDGAAPLGSKYSLRLGMDFKPVTFVSFFDAARFSNWVMNGGNPAANTETGFYTFADATTIPSEAIHSAATVAGRNWVAVASENEWYKAAYYDPASSSYFGYPTKNNSPPTPELPPGGLNSSNQLDAVGGLTDVGAYVGSQSPYGTFDQAGNAFELNDTVVGFNRGIRGGSYSSTSDSGVIQWASASMRDNTGVSGERDSWGFRVTSNAPIPEPTVAALLGSGAILWLRRRRR